MVMMKFGNNAENINKEYLETRIKALQFTVALREWGDIDIEKYDLDELPSELGGKMYKRGYTVERPLQGEVEGGTFDLRDLPTHD